MTVCVADACSLIKYELPQVQSLRVRHTLDGIEALIAPDLALAECTNVLWKYVRAGLCSLDEATETLDAIVRSRVDFQSTQDLLPRALELAALLGHPVYDCVYLSLAMVEDAPVLTTDGRFARMAIDAGLGDLVTLIDGD